MYTGRFAPSPTGPLHFGSLIAAVASYCEAKKQQGKWLVRMEDLDKPREVKGAAANILQQLKAFGFEWDGAVLYQSERSALYNEALDALKQKQLIYPCTCTRKEIADSSSAVGIEGVIYPGTCLRHAIKPHAPIAWRMRTGNALISFQDAIQGFISQNLGADIGDFILKRADGLFAYQLAVVVDDASQGVTHVVRGADLLDSTPRQIYLQRMLDLPTPDYAHIPVAANAAGEKLSKQTLAKPISEDEAPSLIMDALEFLGQQPEQALKQAGLNDIWQWAISHWDIQKVPKKRAIPIAGG